ncbi:MAG TPA: hypothetical protein VFX16_12845 [Pseudonocardiaceae bacterium]|nr:hypothetical protein [Pseudonocardiaceae bacterium]
MTEPHLKSYLSARERAVAMTGQVDAILRAHFDRAGRQEDLAFAYWRPSKGEHRFTAVLTDLVLPDPAERVLDENVAFTADYLTRVLASVPAGGGVALLHSHLGPGWQDMSRTDTRSSGRRLSATASGEYGLLVGYWVGSAVGGMWLVSAAFR